MSPPERKAATYADPEREPDTRVSEILDGQLVSSPRPAFRHAVASSSLTDELVGPFQKGRNGPGGWWIVDEPELRLGPDVLVPELAGWRRERMPSVPDTAAVTLAPDWICEVLSPSTESLDRTRKLPIYRRERVGHAWLINPSTRILEVFRLHEAGWTLVGTHAGDEIVRAEPFDAIELDLVVLWGETRPR